MAQLKNAIDSTGKKIVGRHDFKATSAKVELNEKDKVVTLFADSDFQLNQIKDILFPRDGKEGAGLRQAPGPADRAEGLRGQGQAGSEDQDRHRERVGETDRQTAQRTPSSRCRPASRAIPCAFRAPSAMCCRKRSPWSRRALPISLLSTETSATECQAFRFHAKWRPWTPFFLGRLETVSVADRRSSAYTAARRRYAAAPGVEPYPPAFPRAAVRWRRGGRQSFGATTAPCRNHFVGPSRHGTACPGAGR